MRRLRFSSGEHRDSHTALLCAHCQLDEKGEFEDAFALRVRQSEFKTYFKKPDQDINTAIMRLKKDPDIYSVL